MPLSLRLELSWLRLRAWLLLALGLKRQALQVFDSMLSLSPRYAYALASRAHVLAEAGEHAQAAQSLQQLVALAQPADLQAHAWFNLGYVRSKLGEPDAAIAAFQEATRLNAKLDPAWYGLGLELLLQQRLDEAVAAFKRNTELQPLSPYGWTQLARTHAKRQEPQLARKVVEHLRGFEPKVAEALTRELKLESPQ
jgi:tetratricopeptide (TPR) repeat protein